jgi:putative nucleotidyltransferase with HDIG domain
MDIFPSVVVPAVASWTPRVAEYWVDRSAHVLDRLGREWQRDPEHAKWPDVQLLLADLAAPPDALVRQLPAAARDAMALCDNADLARSELSDRLSRDPSLVQGLLRQANGAFYGAGLSPILRVEAAIDRIGLGGTRAVVLAACVDGLLSKPGAPYDSMLASVWSHMVSTGPLARSLAAQFGADPEEAFAVALLHDVGKLVIFDRISALRTAQRRSITLPDAWLALAIDQLHEPLGAMAAHRWGLGARAADAIGSHHRRERPALRHPLAETLFLAERADHAARESARFDFDGVWGLGQLPGDSQATRGILGRHLQSV